MSQCKGNYCGPDAHTPESIPPQPDKTEELNRTWEDRPGLWMHLPWGYTDDGRLDNSESGSIMRIALRCWQEPALYAICPKDDENGT